MKMIFTHNKKMLIMKIKINTVVRLYTGIKWIQLENIIFSEINQAQNINYRMFSLGYHHHHYFLLLLQEQTQSIQSKIDNLVFDHCMQPLYMLKRNRRVLLLLFFISISIIFYLLYTDIFT